MSKPAPDLKAIFARAIELDPFSERDAYLAEACGDNESLRREVQSLIRAHNQVGDFLETPTFLEGVPALTTVAERPGVVIGQYTLLEQIGEGGMGTVYLAEQSEPFRRMVALKIIKAGLDTRQVIARFEAERQALALMEHPHIAKVLDAGATDSGRPYFVMEIIRGAPITEYCDHAGLNPRARVELLVQVCHAVQHAHQKGIIHRDLKPSNILVTLVDGRAVPKVIDFGVAKAVDQRLTERSYFTGRGTIIGTLDYMSPEQADDCARGVDTRSDVYALGVVLFELLTGTTPLERQRHRNASYLEFLHRIRVEDAPKPSSRVMKSAKAGEFAASRSLEPLKLVRLLRRELDWIALKALQKLPDERYATANDLARDLERYLADEPVEAGPPSTLYRVRRYARKHRLAFLIGGAFLALIILASVISTALAIRVASEAERARQSEAEAKVMLTFFHDKVLFAARPKGQKGGLGSEVTLRAALDAAEPGIATEFAAQPRLEAAVRNSLGTSYLYLGRPESAVRQHLRASMLREQALGPDHPETHVSLNNLAAAYQAAGRSAEAIPILERLWTYREAKLGPNHPDTLLSMNNLAVAYRQDGRNAKAVPLLEDVVRRRTAQLGPSHRDVMNALNNLAVALQAAGRPAEAVSILERTSARCRALFGPEHPDTLKSMHNLASAYLVAGSVENALALFRETLERRRAVLGPEHPDTLTTLNNLAAAELSVGDKSRAVALFAQVHALRQGRLGAEHLDTLSALSNLALAQQSAGRTDEAVTKLEKVLGSRKSKLGAGHSETLKSMNNLADAYLEQKRWKEAKAVLLPCLKLRERASGIEDWRRSWTMSQLGAALAGLEDYEHAEPLLIEGYEGLHSHFGTNAPARKELIAAAGRVVPFYEAWGQPEKRDRWRSKLAPTSPLKTSSQ